MKGDKQAYQIRLWALAGPLICLFSLFVMTVKNPQVPFFLPFTLLIGMPLCWQWRLWGWLGTAFILFAFLVYSYNSFPLEERFWLMGMSFSNVLALLITALSFEEMGAQIENLGVESRSRLENLWKVDEKKQALEHELMQSKEEIEHLTIKMRSFQKVVDHSTEEMNAARVNYEKVLKKVYELKEENIELRRQLGKTGVDPQLEAKYTQLREQFQEKAQILDQARRDLFISNEKLARLQKELDEERWYSLNEVEESLEQHLFAVSKEKEDLENRHQVEVDTLQSLLDQYMMK